MYINEKLKEVYNSNWSSLSSELNKIIEDSSKSIKPANPLLLKVTNEFEAADIRIMIFGQETNGWEGDFQGDISISLDIYNDFFNSENCFSYGGQFWNGISRFLKIVREKYPNKKVSFLWNNVVKIGGSGSDINCPPDYIYNIENNFFNIIGKEIELLNPNVIIFFSGPNYDRKIINCLQDVNFNPISEKYDTRKIAKIEYKNYKNIFRTYHPNYLWRNGIDDYLKEIIDKIEI
jgi:hypothetical protein